MRDTSPAPPSPRTALTFGLLAIVCGVLPILGSIGIVPMRLTPGTPVWVGVCAGMLFVLAGVLMINGYVLGGGPLNSSTNVEPYSTAVEPYRHFIQDLLGFGVCALFAAIFGWIAFGPGERQFSMTVDLPFSHSKGRGNEWLGRVMFGLGAVMGAGLCCLRSHQSFSPASLNSCRRLRDTSSSAERSPGSCPAYMARITRRMTLPFLVFGNSCTNRTASGLSAFPMACFTRSFNSCSRAGLAPSHRR